MSSTNQDRRPCCGVPFSEEHHPNCMYSGQAQLERVMMPPGTPAVLGANAIQIGGEHYKKGGEEHWDRAWRLKYDAFQYIITKWVERWREKGGIEDLRKAQHAIQKYIELVQTEKDKLTIQKSVKEYPDAWKGPDQPKPVSGETGTARS